MKGNNTGALSTESTDAFTDWVPSVGSGQNYAGERGGPSGAVAFAITTKTALVVGFCANLIALYIIKRCQKMKDFNTNEITGTFLKYLLCLDTLACLISTLQSFGREWLIRQPYVCNLQYPTYLFFSWGTGFINMLLCVERCIAVAAPFWYYSHASTWKAHVAAMICIISALLLSLLPVLGLGSYRKYWHPFKRSYDCISPTDFSYEYDAGIFAFAIIFLIVGLGIVVIIHVSNMIVVINAIKIGRRSKKISVSFGLVSSLHTDNKNAGLSSYSDSKQDGILNGKTQQKLVNKEIRLALVIVALSFVFTVAWLPFYAVRAFRTFSDNENDVPFNTTIISLGLYILNYVLDPFIYVFLKGTCRRELFRLIRRAVCCGSLVEVSKAGKSVNG